MIHGIIRTVMVTIECECQVNPPKKPLAFPGDCPYCHGEKFYAGCVDIKEVAESMRGWIEDMADERSDQRIERALDRYNKSNSHG